MSHKLLGQLKAIKTSKSQMNPDSLWVIRNRAALMARAQSVSRREPPRHWSEKVLQSFGRIGRGAHIFVPTNILAAARYGVAVCLIAGMAVSSWIASVSASQDSLPGEPLYNVKLAAEKTELFVATVIGSEQGKASTNLKHAAEKVAEYHKAKSPEQAAVSIQSLKKKIESTNESLTKIEKQSPEKAVAVAKVVEEKTEQILEALAEKPAVPPVAAVTNAGADLPPTAPSDHSVAIENKELKKEVVEVKSLIEETGVKAVGVLVEQVATTDAANGAPVGEQEVRQKLEKKLVRLVSDLTALDQEVEKTSQLLTATTTIGAAPITTVSTTASAVVVTTNTPAAATSSATTTGGGNPVVVEDPLVQMEKAEQRVQEATKRGREILLEVEKLIQQNDLRGALQKVQEVKTVKQEARTLITNAQVVVDAVVSKPGVLNSPSAVLPITSSSTDQTPVTVAPVSTGEQASTTAQTPGVTSGETTQALISKPTQ